MRSTARWPLGWAWLGAGDVFSRAKMGDFIVKIPYKWRFLAGKIIIITGKYHENGGFTGKMFLSIGKYHLVMTNIAMENHHYNR